MIKSTFLFVAIIVLAGCAGSSKSVDAKEPAEKSVGAFLRLDSSFDALVPKDARIEKVAGGFTFTEGPVWRPWGALWFSDVIGNVVRQWTPDGKVTEILNPGGYSGQGLPPGGFNGPNGMTPDKDNAILLCQHGYRRIVRIDNEMRVSTLVDRFEGKKLNSPNDLVYRSDGSLYFTDPPYGLPKDDSDPAKELSFNGVFRLKDGKLTALVKDLKRPNGIGFSPDEKLLYVSDSDEKHKAWMRYNVDAEGNLSGGSVIADVTAETADGLPDGLKVDSVGNLYGSGPGGVWVFSPEGKHIGTIKPPETPANVAWGDDGKSLYITARTSVYRVKLAVTGERTVY